MGENRVAWARAISAFYRCPGSETPRVRNCGTVSERHAEPAALGAGAFLACNAAMFLHAGRCRRYSDLGASASESSHDDRCERYGTLRPAAFPQRLSAFPPCSNLPRRMVQIAVAARRARLFGALFYFSSRGGRRRSGLAVTMRPE